MLAQRCANVGHVGHIALIRRWANIHSIRWPNVSWHIKSHLAHRISLDIKYYAVLGRKISSSAYATTINYNVYFQRNTVLVVLFMFTFINFHNSMMVGFFLVIINFGDSLSESWHDKTYKTTNTKTRLHNRLGYTAALRCLLHLHIKDCDQTARMRRLIRDFYPRFCCALM